MAPRAVRSSMSLRTLRSFAVIAHRWLSLAAAAFWLVQAATGVFAVFHWEIDDATVAGESKPLDLAALERRAADLVAAVPGRRIDSIWTSAGVADRFDIHLVGVPPERDRVVRVDGAGTVLRSREDGERLADGGLVESLILVHQKLLAGDTGKRIVGASGLLLLSNLFLGVFVAWPRSGPWRRALAPCAHERGTGAPVLVASRARTLAGAPRRLPGRRRSAPRLRDVHGAPGATGAGRSADLDDAGRRGAAGRHGAGRAQRSRPLSGSGALRHRLSHRRRRLVGDPAPAIRGAAARLRQDARLCQRRGRRDRRRLRRPRVPPGRRFVDSLFAFHTGEMGGRTGRIGALAIGLWLLSMCALGIRLWWTRRRPRRDSTRAAGRSGT